MSGLASGMVSTYLVWWTPSRRARPRRSGWIGRTPTDELHSMLDFSRCIFAPPVPQRTDAIEQAKRTERGNVFVLGLGLNELIPKLAKPIRISEPLVKRRLPRVRVTRVAALELIVEMLANSLRPSGCSSFG